MPHMRLTFHTDPGHGWLFVSHLQLQTLGLSIKSFTEYSYRDADGVYAEEDFDAGTVLKAHEKMFGEQPHVDYKTHNDSAPFRRYARCTGNFDDIVASAA